MMPAGILKHDAALTDLFHTTPKQLHSHPGTFPKKSKDS